MIQSSFDPAKYVQWFFRINRDNKKVIVFYDSAGSSFSLATYTFVLNFKIRKDASSNFLQLTEGAGLIKSSNQLTIQPTKVQASKFQNKIYFTELIVTESSLDRTWIVGDSTFHNGKFDGVSGTQQIVIDDFGTLITASFQ